jgi:hypothetical protein
MAPISYIFRSKNGKEFQTELMISKMGNETHFRLWQNETSIGKLVAENERELSGKPRMQLSNIANQTPRDQFIPGIGYFLIKRFILSVPHRNIRLLSLDTPVLFYWKLGFRHIREEQAAKTAQEIERAKKYRVEPVLDGGWMTLPLAFRPAWEEIAASEEPLQLSLKGHQTPIYHIQTYLISER